MEKSFGLIFFIKKPKTATVSQYFVYMRITTNASYCDVSTKMKWDPTKWNAQAGRAEGRTEAAKTLNSYLDVLQRKVYDIRKRLADRDDPVTAENIKALLQGDEIKRKKYMLLEIFQQHNDQMTALVGQEFSRKTLERYQTAFRHIRAFLQWKYKIDDIDITELNYEFVTEYEFWLKSVRKCSHNPAIKYIANFRKIVNRCLRNGWLQKDPFVGFKMTKKEVERTALTEFELEAISALTFKAERLRLVRDIFLFSCYTGLAYVDVAKSKRSEVFIGVDGEQWLLSKRQKTDISARIPLLPPALKILEQYNGHPQCQHQDRLLPVLSNQKTNAYLKEIADQAGITKNLTFHIARHTFATTVTLSNGVPIETVSKMLGHRNLRTTQQYAKILDRKVSEDMMKLKGKFK
ncbi:site-specific integrase [Paraflavitalea sp. CAU 1676]|uniref:site-specific integrase n=1 Tax=Paraflavitalea sp. CAU 1676 TaxID=3032598 RepID=UPI0023DA848B|nr:site-specific integrase [Paraflavitalea sp. CAU 1676]MDF2188294.1 site-specific integrase [Paraflavitalea sp. CAU 1676]